MSNYVSYVCVPLWLIETELKFWNCKPSKVIDELYYGLAIFSINNSSGRPVIDRSRFPREISKRLGESLTVHCTANGIPQPLLRWYFDGKPLGGNLSKLTIASLDNENFGVYQCEAHNEAGADIAAIWVTKICMQISFFLLAFRTFGIISGVKKFTYCCRFREKKKILA